MNNYISYIPKFNIISAYNNNYVIADKNNILPWINDTEFSWDLKNFYKITENKVVIMGYNTYKTFKKPLKNRYNIVISKDEKEKKISLKDFNNLLEYKDNKFIFVKNIEMALIYIIFSNIKYNYNFNESYIIGGSKTYLETIEKNIAYSGIISLLKNDYEGKYFFPIEEFKKKFILINTIDYKNGFIYEYNSYLSIEKINNNILKLINNYIKNE